VELILVGVVVPAILAGFGCWLGYQLLQQNGRLWLRIEALEQRLAEEGSAPEAGTPSSLPAHEVNGHAAKVNRGNRSLADSHIDRNGLPAGTPAPPFILPRLGGGELSLEEFRGRKVLLVFSDPMCGPCDVLASRLAKCARRAKELQVVMVSRGDVEANQAKVERHRLPFPVALQRQWEISRRYAMFATPIAYLIDEDGILAADVAKGPAAILALLSAAAALADGKARTADGPLPAGREELLASR
jgi:peroxiredoxin